MRQRKPPQGFEVAREPDGVRQFAERFGCAGENPPGLLEIGGQLAFRIAPPPGSNGSGA